MKASGKARIDIHLEHAINYILQPKKLGEVNLAGRDIISEDFSRENLEAAFKYGEPGLVSPIVHTMSLSVMRKTILTLYQRKCYTRMYLIPSNRADYMRISVAEKVCCYGFDDVYEEAKLLTDYCAKEEAIFWLRCSILMMWIIILA